MADGRQAAHPLVGRDPELDILRAALRSARHGPCRVVIVEGEAGIGKSRLLEEAVVHAEGLGFGVLRGSAEEFDSGRPFGALARAVGAEPEPGEGLVEPGVDQAHHHFVEKLVAALVREARDRPVLLAVEDLHWADPPTLSAVRALCRRVVDLPVLLLLTLRPTPRRCELSVLLDRISGRASTHLTLAPLPEESVGALVRAALGAAPGPVLRAQAARAGGNPLWVLELLEALREAGALDVGDQGVELRRAELPESLRSTILRRVSLVPPETLHVLRVAAVLGSSFDPGDLATCLGRSAVEALPLVADAAAAGLVAGAGERMAFRHDLVWQVLYEELPGPLRRALHLDAGRALARAGRPASVVATHFAIGASPGDAEAVEWLQRAARETAPRAPGVAAGLLERALSLVEPSDQRGDELTAERVAALVRGGRPAEAETLARERLVWAPDSAVAGHLRWGLAAALQMQGRLGEALEETLRAVGARGLAPWRRARLLAEASQWSFYTGDPEKASALAEEAIAAGQGHDDDVAVCLGLTALSRIALDRLEFPQAIALSSQAVERARDSGVQRKSVDWIHPAFDLGGAFVTADRLGEAEETLTKGRRLREELGSTWDLPLFTGALAHVALYAGRWDDAVAEAETVLAMAEEGGAKGNLLWTYSLLAYVALHRDELDVAGDVLCAADGAGGASPRAMGSDAVAWCTALLHEARGDVARAADLVLEAWEHPLPFKAVVRVRIAPDAVRLALATGADAAARSVTVLMEQMARGVGSPLYRGIARRCRGLLQRDAGQLLDAATILRGAARPLETAFACEDAAVVLGDQGKVPEAVSLLDEAVVAYERVSAARDVARAHAALRRLGVRHGRRGPRPRQRSGWGSLTKSERDVVDLVVDGLTNAEIGARLFVSGRTVETHLSHVYRKLAIGSRVELAAEAARRAG
ncbi:MAG TPA: AAA family ATPase [Acidimicrobiales bacterium]|nr:AAA family ATPase [Acidimicrobiales bacterium]